MTAAVETGLWTLDPTASTVGVRHRTMWGLVTVKGTFGGVAGQGEVRADGSATGTVTLDAGSLDTGNAKRDTHLRGADFFDAETHPRLAFAVHTAQLVDSTAGTTVKVTGELTVRGVTRPQSFTARLAPVGADAVGLEAEFSVDRAAYGMGWNQLGMMRGEATVTAVLRFTRAAA